MRCPRAVLDLDDLAWVLVPKIEEQLATFLLVNVKSTERVQIRALARFQVILRLLPTLTRVALIDPEGKERYNGER
jgi:hypothetical protein